MASKSPVLAYDLGGTKVAVGAVTPQGKILEEQRVPVLARQGKEVLIRQLADLGRSILKKYPRIQRAGIASAGPLDPARGILLDPTNLAGPGKGWGQVHLTAALFRRLKIPVTMDNDAAAAMLAESWLGAARGYQNAMILTLGTGLGTGIIANGKLVRAGRGLHPEAGHLIIHANDMTASCGCGNLGCAEAYLSGKNFALRAQRSWSKPHEVKNYQGAEFADLARKGHPEALELFERYAEHMAITLHNYVVIYAPEIIVLTGSFAATADLFLKPARKKLELLLKRRRVGIDMMPKITTSKLNNEAGLLGGAYLALYPPSARLTR